MYGQTLKGQAGMQHGLKSLLGKVDLTNGSLWKWQNEQERSESGLSRQRYLMKEQEIGRPPPSDST